MSDTDNEVITECKSLIKASERRLTIIIQIVGILCVLLASFLYYLAHIRLKMTQDFLENTMTWHVKMTERLQALEKGR